jgi:hypothetical protein
MSAGGLGAVNPSRILPEVSAGWSRVGRRRSTRALLPNSSCSSSNDQRASSRRCIVPLECNTVVGANVTGLPLIKMGDSKHTLASS